jgi:UDP-perosamine 4-acetyltransferase
LKGKIILMGGGGHAKVVIELIRLCGVYEIAGILVPEPVAGTKVSGVEVVGSDEKLPGLYAGGVVCAAICVGGIGDTSVRRDLYERVRAAGLNLPPLVHPKAVVSPDAVLSEGVQVMAGAVVQTGSRIGVNAVINTSAVVEHDSVINDHAFVSPGATVLGGCVVGRGAFIGAGAVVLQNVKIGDNCVVAAGAVVIDNVAAGARVKGVPAGQY